MIFSIFRQKKHEPAIEPLYGAIMAAALNPELYLHFDVPDTFEGRFESASLHVAMVLRRLRQLPPPAENAAQELVDRFFDGLDSAMRQTGVSDNALPKRIKKFAQGFYGRLESYTEALEPDAPQSQLAEVLQRNLLEGAEASPDLCAYVRNLMMRLQGVTLEQLMENTMVFKDNPRNEDARS